MVQMDKLAQRYIFRLQHLSETYRLKYKIEQDENKMAKTIGFVETASEKVIKFEKQVVTVKGGALTIERIRNSQENIFRVIHFGTVILEVNFNKSTRHLFDCITKWHIQSNTDANYIYTIISGFNSPTPFEVGYKPVNGGGYFRFKNNMGEWTSPEGRTSSQW